MEFILKIPWSVLLFACLTLGLAPFNPPHIWEKLTMLFSGSLHRFVDWLDMVIHGCPWVLLVYKITCTFLKK